MISQTDILRRAVARVAAMHLDELSTSQRVLVCEGIATLYPAESSEARAAREHASHLREIERQQLLLTELLKS